MAERPQPPNDAPNDAPNGAPNGASGPDDAAAPARCDGRLLEFLICPVTRSPLRYDAKRQELISKSARLAYPIRDGIAILVADEARSLDD